MCGWFIERTWKRCSLLVVFLVSGVVKTVFWRFKTKIKEFFCFSPRTKGSKVGLRGNF